MRNQNWFCAEDGTIRSKGNDNNNGESVRESNHRGNLEYQNNRITGQVIHTSVPVIQPMVERRRNWDKLEDFPKFMIIISIIICAISITFFALTKTFFVIMEASLFLNIVMWILPIALFIINVATSLQWVDEVIEWVGASIVSLFGQIVLWQDRAEILGQVIGFIAMIIASAGFCMWIGDALYNNWKYALYIIAFSLTMAMAIWLGCYSKSENYSVWEHIQIMIPTLITSCSAAIKTFKRERK